MPKGGAQKGPAEAPRKLGKEFRQLLEQPAWFLGSSENPRRPRAAAAPLPPAAKRQKKAAAKTKNVKARAVEETEDKEEEEEEEDEDDEEEEDAAEGATPPPSERPESTAGRTPARGLQSVPPREEGDGGEAAVDSALSLLRRRVLRDASDASLTSEQQRLQGCVQSAALSLCPCLFLRELCAIKVPFLIHRLLHDYLRKAVKEQNADNGRHNTC